MNRVHGLAFYLLFALTVAAGIGIAAQQSSEQKPGAQAPAGSKESEVARGQYLVEQVARCVDCHTPRDSEGRLDRLHWLQGSPIWIQPSRPIRPWASQAPDLAGFPYSDQQGQDVLERGIGTNGNPLQLPMPSFHLRHEDAVAIIAYLRSL